MKVLSQKGYDKFIFKWVIQLLNVGIGLRKIMFHCQTGEEVHTWLHEKDKAVELGTLTVVPQTM